MVENMYDEKEIPEMEKALEVVYESLNNMAREYPGLASSCFRSRRVIEGIVIRQIRDIENGDFVKIGKWLLEAHKEPNYRWSVTAECSECCDELIEIWTGFFPNVPDSLARDVALISAKDAKTAKPSKYCPNCGARMVGE